MNTYGLGKPRTKFGKWCDRKGLSQQDIIKMTGVNRGTVSNLCSKLDHEPYEETVLMLIGGLRRHGYDVTVWDFW